MQPFASLLTREFEYVKEKEQDYCGRERKIQRCKDDNERRGE